MKILFTKTGIESEVSEKVKTPFSAHYQDFIKTDLLQVENFDVSAKALLFTSTNGVKAFIKNGFKFNGNIIFSVGRKTADLLESLGQKSQNFENAKALTIYLDQNFSGKILHFCSDIALNISTINTEIHKVTCYRTALLYPKTECDFDAICFFSPSAVRSFVKNNSLEGKIIFSIGLTTTAELKKFTSEQIHTARNSLEDMLNEVRMVYKTF